MNTILRSTYKGASKTAPLQSPKKATVSWAGTTFVAVEDIRQLLEDYSHLQEELRGEVKDWCEKYGKPIPLEFLPPGAEDTLAARSITTESPRPKFAALQKEEEFNKGMERYSQSFHKVTLARRLAEDTITEAQRTRAAELALAKKSYDKSSVDTSVPFSMSTEALFVQSHARLPKLVEAVQGVSLEYFSAKSILPQDYPKLLSFIMKHGDNSRWFAPQEALSATDSPLPLTQRYESLCVRNLSLSDRSIKSINKELREALAWKWLIISHNHVCDVKERVHLPVRLTLAYERQRREPKRSTLPFDKDTVESLRQIVTGFAEEAKSRAPPVPTTPMVPKQQVSEYVGSVWAACKFFASSYAEFDESEYTISLKQGKDSFKSCVKKWNTVLAQGRDLYLGNPIEALPEEAPEPLLDDMVRRFTETLDKQPTAEEAEDALDFEEAEWLAKHPESFDKDGLSFYRHDIEILTIDEGQTYVSMFHNGVEYHAIVKESSGPAKSKKARGKTAVIPYEPKASKATSPKPNKSGGQSDVPVTARENPLRVKGEPKSKALSDDQRKALRAFFKLKDGLVPPEEWALLDKAGRQTALKERSIPRWASEAVLRSPANLQSILEGKLTVDNANSAARVPNVGRTKVSSQALEAWQQLKSDFRGTPLLKSPHSQKEKAFRKRFDQLVVDYGEQQCFPKLRDRPDQQGRSPSRGRGRANVRDQDQGLIESIKTIGELFRAFSGKG
jgi:hypothetical protein